ncbi:MAG: hypothetical protein H7Z10_15760 [Gemmatimonadaceae bacterium]|nr:hypothetical protein [Acetobacteraceae bacterium]
MTDKPKSDLTWLPNMAIGAETGKGREIAPDEDDDPDDELLAVTPLDVVAMLGFDPLDMDDEEPEEAPA